MNGLKYGMEMSMVHILRRECEGISSALLHLCLSVPHPAEQMIFPNELVITRSQYM
jgi:hypothetical protein